jgi:putative transposase
MQYHRPVEGIVKRANVSRNLLGEYFVSLMCERQITEESGCGNNVLGIDINIKERDENTRAFIAMSDGKTVDIPRFYTGSTKRLIKPEQKRAKCTLGSKQWQKYNRHIKHVYDDVANKKDNWLHNLSAQLARTYDYIVFEDIPLTGFHKKRKTPEEATNMELAADRGKRKAWTETPHSEFIRQITYKLGEDRVIYVDPAYTSKMCNQCGAINEKLTLSDREWTCPQCGAQLDRDINAAINIRNKGIGALSNPTKTTESGRRKPRKKPIKPKTI